MNISGKSIGKLIKEARERKGLTQEQLTDIVGKRRSYISRVETEYGDNIKLQTLIEIVEKGLGGTVEINFKL